MKNDWYAVETLLVDGKLIKTEVVADTAKGKKFRAGVFSTYEEFPHNSCQREFDGAMELHVDWFEDIDTARGFSAGRVTYEHLYRMKPVGVNTLFPELIRRRIIPVGEDAPAYREKRLYIDTEGNPITKE